MIVSMILASRQTYRTSSERRQRRASSEDDKYDDKYAHKDTNTQIQRQIQERKGQNAEKAIHVAYFRKGWLPRAKLKKIQEGIVGFGCNFGGMIAHLYGSHSPGYTQIKQG